MASRATNRRHSESNTFTSLWPTHGQEDPFLGHVGQSYLATPWMLRHLQLWEIISHSSKENMCPPVETTVKLTSIRYLHVTGAHTQSQKKLPSIPELHFRVRISRVFSYSRRIWAPGRFSGFFYMQKVGSTPMFPLWLCATRYYSQLSTGGTEEERRLFISSLSWKGWVTTGERYFLKLWALCDFSAFSFLSLNPARNSIPSPEYFAASFELSG